MPVFSQVTSQYYPTLEDVLNLIRALANDSFPGATERPGEGQILTDLYAGTGHAPDGEQAVANPWLLALFNSSIREMYRKLRNVKTPALIRDNYILSALPVVNGPLGASVPDPTVQTYLAFAGYWDGSTLHTDLTLPPDLLQPLKMWERVADSTDIFVPLKEAQDGLQPRDQLDMLTVWEWREGQINFVGSTQQRDVRLRYLAFLPTFFPSPASLGYFQTTQIPIFDCQEAVAYATLEKVSAALGSPMSTRYQALFTDAMQDLKNQQVRRMQATNYTRKAYNDQDSMGLDVYGI
jgi:hypothetical protein